MSKAIFLDRDGTINEEINYLTKPEDIRLIPNTIEALHLLKTLGFINIIITNQSGIARGYLTESDLENIHREFKVILRYSDTDLIDDIFYSPFHTEGTVGKYKTESECRKPGIGMILKAEAKHKISLSESYLIGDSYTDMKCGENAGIKKILVRTGYGSRDLERCLDEKINLEYVADDLYDASLFLIKKQQKVY